MCGRALLKCLTTLSRQASPAVIKLLNERFGMEER
jgi:hypothetical protein